MMKNIVKMAVVCFFFVQGLHAEANIDAGQKIAATCAACHSQDGNSELPANPKLAGQHQGYLYSQLKAYKGEAVGRENAIMAGMVASLSAEDMKNVSAYFAAQEPKEAYANEKYVSLGEKIYKGGNPETGVPACSACHGPTGQGNAPANYPVLAGQHAEYTIDQLKKFRSGQRYNDPNGMMRGAAKRMTDEEIKAVAEYLVGLY